MTPPIDLTQLRIITAGDQEIEIELFTNFIQCSKENSSLLQASVDDNKKDIWKNTAHAIKGMALNIGANTLSELGREAEELTSASPTEKQIHYAKIKEEIEKVNTFLASLYDLKL